MSAAPDVPFAAGFLSAVPAVVARCDRAGRITYISPGARTLLGYEPEELVGHPMFDFLHPDDVASAYARLGKACSSHGVVRGRCRHRHASGGWVWLETAGLARRSSSGEVLDIWSIASDVGEQVGVESALRHAVADRAQADARFRLVFEHSPAGMALVSDGGAFIGVNPALTRLAGMSEADLLQMRIQDLVFPEDAEIHRSFSERLIAGEIDRFTKEERYARPDGTIVWIEATVLAVRDACGAIEHYIAHIVDIDHRKAQEVQLRREALHDELTGLPNRRLIYDRLAQALAVDERPHAGVALAFVDLERLKETNDAFGRAAGDEVLIEVARRLERIVRTGDTVGRLGSDEFVVVCQGGVDGKDAALLVSRITSIMQEPVAIGAETVSVRASVGAVVVHDVTADEAIALADEAIYEAKRRRWRA